MSTKHTPGPWEARVWTCSKYSEVIGMGWNIVDAKGHLVPLRAMESCDDDPEEPEANARLIAAAPELLEALKRCMGSLRAVSPGGDGDPDVEFARAAIAKATGEQA